MTAPTISEIIRQRRSIFPPAYINRPIADETLLEILENANFAPTHRLTQPWRFVIFKDAGLNKLADFLGENYRQATPPESFSQAKYDSTKDKILLSGAVIAICVQYNTKLVPQWEDLAATATAVQNMWLTASALGIGAYWSTPGNALTPLTTWLELPENQHCIGLFYMGYHESTPPPARRSGIEEKLTWIKA